MKLSLLVVQPVEDAFEVRNFRKVAHEVMQQAFIVDIVAFWDLRIDVLGILEKTALLDLLVLEQFMEEFEVLQLEKGVESTVGR
jgi:hypothetical protein